MSVAPLQSIFLDESLHSRQSFWYYWQIKSTHSWTRKTPQRRTLQNNTPPTWKMDDISRLMFRVELRRPCQPLTLRPMPASNGRQSTSDATQFYGLRGAEWPKCRHRCGMRTQDVLFRDLLVVKKILRSMWAFSSKMPLQRLRPFCMRDFFFEVAEIFLLSR